MGCSALKGHLFHFLKVIDTPQCACGFYLESPDHYFLNCPLFAAHRYMLLNTISNITTTNINILLFGNINCWNDENIMIRDAVLKFIADSKRFKLSNELF